jgi:hypothetical protein
MELEDDCAAFDEDNQSIDSNFLVVQRLYTRLVSRVEPRLPSSGSESHALQIVLL